MITRGIVNLIANAAAPPGRPHDGDAEVERPTLMISMPRSGSDWFAEKCLLWAWPDYFREYFNPVCNFERAAALRQAFGSEVDWEGIAVPWECQDEIIEHAFLVTFRREPHPIYYTKENYAAFKIGFFRRHFDCFAMVGHRRLTFPGGSRPHYTAYWWLRYFQSLEFNAALLDEDVGRLVDRALSSPLDSRRKMVAAQVIATYQTVRECSRLAIPVLEYRRLLEIGSGPEVAGYLRGKLPAPAEVEGVADRVVRTRRVADKSSLYEAWGVEGFAEALIGMIPSHLASYF